MSSFKVILRCFVLLVLLVVAVYPKPSSAFPELDAYLGKEFSVIESAMKKLNMTPDQVRIDQSDLMFFGGSRYKLPIMDVYFNNPWKISAYTRMFTDGILKSSDKFAAMVSAGQRRTGKGSYGPIQNNPLPGYDKRCAELKTDDFAVALAELTGRPASDYKTSAYSSIPTELKTALAKYCFAAKTVLQMRERSLLEPIRSVNLDQSEVYNLALDFVINEGMKTDDPERSDTESALIIEKLLDNIDWDGHYTAATLLAVATQNLFEIADKMFKTTPKPFFYQVETPLGLLIIDNSSYANTTYNCNNYFIVIDSQGNDTYKAGAGNQSVSNPISLIIDVAGNDVYSTNSKRQPAFGAGVMGYGFLIDLQGNDKYYNAYAGQGFGLFGEGILYDTNGDDSYDGINNLQGAGNFGVGLLIDLKGSDNYNCYNCAQGYGYTMGVGYLVDTSGNDKYSANIIDIKYSGPFGPQENINMVQGFGYGRRSDYSDGHSWAGGVGMLVEGAGNDQYLCDVYGQGSAYWYSLGVLADKQGDDVYDAGAYSIGASPHFAIGVLQDDAGNDTYYGYQSAKNFGLGRDFSIGWFEDSDGNDKYQGTYLSFGVGDINGIGVFWDKKGNDCYLSVGDEFGRCLIESIGSVRDYMLSFGLFVDGQGIDEYYTIPEKPREKFIGQKSKLPGISFIKNESSWIRDPHFLLGMEGKDPKINIIPGQRGIGIDKD